MVQMAPTRYKSFMVKAVGVSGVCAYPKKVCRATKGLKKNKDEKYYCPAHVPGEEAKVTVRLKKAQRNSVRARKANGKAALLHLTIEPNKASILKSLIAQVNFLGFGVRRTELRKHRLIIELMDRIHEYALEEGDEEIKAAKVVAIMESKLPDTIKLSKLVDLVGADEAMKLVPVVMVRDSYEDRTIDGQALLAGESKDGATIGKPQAMTYAEGEGDQTADVSEPMVPLAEPPSTEEKKKSEAVPPPALPTPETSPPKEEPVKAPPPEATSAPSERTESSEERASRCYRQGRELMGLYRSRVSGSFQAPSKIAQKFHAALLEGVPFLKLQQRINHPKSAGDQPDAMIHDVKLEMAPTP